MGALAEDVVDAVVDDVSAKVGIVSCHCGDLRLGANAIDRADEQWVLHFGEQSLEKGSKSADPSDDALALGCSDIAHNSPQCALSFVDVYASGCISQFLSHLAKATRWAGIIFASGSVAQR